MSLVVGAALLFLVQVMLAEAAPPELPVIYFNIHLGNTTCGGTQVISGMAGNGTCTLALYQYFQRSAIFTCASPTATSFMLALFPDAECAKEGREGLLKTKTCYSYSGIGSMDFECGVMKIK